MNSPTPEQVRAIRAAWDSRTLNVRAWADALDCSLETVRRIGRRDTYRNVDRGVAAGIVRSLPPLAADPTTPSEEEIAVSLARLRGLVDRLPEGPEAAERALEGLKGGDL